MLFNSFIFLLFFPIVIAVYYALPLKPRLWWLFTASCFFYMYAYPPYILVLFGLIILDYICAIWISRTSNAGKRKVVLIVSIAANAFVLISFKYYDFLMSSTEAVTKAIGLDWQAPLLHWVLPIGLSFHTFQSISYVVDVYRRTIKPEKNLLIYGLYVMFFPQLVAGPIERAGNMIPQFYRKHSFDPQALIEGFRLILWGLFQKVVVADRLAIIVDRVYAQPSAYNSFEISLVLILFFVQVYADFCGYSDIARGCARAMGYKLSLNFNNPLASENIREFWERWHISLTLWIRSYVLKPLIRSRIFSRWPKLNIIVSFLFSGLWHGAGWTYALWGVMNGIACIWKRPVQLHRIKLPMLLGVSMILYGEGLLGVLFRSPDMVSAWAMYERLATSWHVDQLLELPSRLGLSVFDWLLDIALAGLIIGLQIVLKRRGISYGEFHLLPDRWRASIRIAAYYAVLSAIFLWGEFGAHRFVYFQF